MKGRPMSISQEVICGHQILMEEPLTRLLRFGEYNDKKWWFSVGDIDSTAMVR